MITSSRSTATRAQPEPERPVAAEERHHHVDELELGIGVEEQGADVDGDQADAGQGGGAVHLVEPEAAEAGDRPSRAATMPSTMLMVNMTRATTPVPRPRAHSASVMPPPPVGQPPRVTSVPCVGDKAGRKAGAAQPGEGVVALDHGRGGGGVGPQRGGCDDRDAAPGTLGAGAGVDGSTRWWRCTPPWVQARFALLEVATAAPGARVICWGTSLGRSWTSTCQPPSGAGPAVAMSPPRLTSTPVSRQRGHQLGHSGRRHRPSRSPRGRAAGRGASAGAVPRG